MYRKDIISGMQSMIDRNSNYVAEQEQYYNYPRTDFVKEMFKNWRDDQTVMKRAMGEIMRAWK